jgi:hypothetical protein
MSDDLSLDDFFSSLDAEVSKLTAKPRLEAEKKALLQKVRKGDPDRQGRIILAGQIKEITAQLEAIQWRQIATIGLFQEQHCTFCGSIHRMFLQFMAKQEATSGPKCTRFVRSTKMEAGFPSETVLHKTKTTVCSDCAGDFGFDLDNAMTKLGEVTEPFAIPQGYVQEEEELEG